MPFIHSQQLVQHTILSPVFLVGAERSGTTLLRLMMDAHPKIAMQGEYEFLVDKISEAGELPSREIFERHVRGDRVFKHWNLSLPPALGFFELANHFLAEKQNEKEAQVVGATIHRRFDKILKIWPEARFVHIVRDGRDVAFSRIRMGWAGNLFTGIREWVAVESLWAVVAEMLQSAQHITIRYEDLVRDPNSELQRICAFLRLPYSDSMLQYDKTSTYKQPTRSPLAKWRNISEAVIAAAESEAGPWLQHHGYALATRPRSPSTAFKFVLMLQDRLYRSNFRRRRYGAKLWLQEVFARRLGLHRTLRVVSAKLHEVDDRYVQ